MEEEPKSRRKLIKRLRGFLLVIFPNEALKLKNFALQMAPKRIFSLRTLWKLLMSRRRRVTDVNSGLCASVNASDMEN